MPKALDANQLKKIDRHYNRPIYLLHLSTLWVYSTGAAQPDGTTKITGYGTYWIDAGVKAGDTIRITGYGWYTIASIESNTVLYLSTTHPALGEPYSYQIKKEGIFYFSDRNIYYNGHNYEDYLFDLSDLENQIRNFGGYDNTLLRLHFKNDRIRDKNYLIELFDEYCIEGQYIEGYKLLTDTGETFGSDVSTEIFKGEMGQPYDIDDIGFYVDCSLMLFGKNAKLPLDVIDSYDFSGADPDDIGKYRNIIIGNAKKVICPWTDAGWASSLTADITAVATSIEISEIGEHPWMEFTAICDQEEIVVGSHTGNILTVNRGYGGTTAAAHNRGSIIYEKKSDFEVEVANHPVKAIGDIFVSRRGEWVRLIEGFTKYQNFGGRAIIRLTDKAKFEEKINITATVETTPDEGNHDHAIPAGGFSSKQCIPDGSSGAEGHANVIDGNTASYCAISPEAGVQAQFNGETNLGTISRVQIWIYKIDTAATGYVQSPNGTNLQILPAQAGWFRIVKTSGMSWGDSVVIIGGAGGNQIAEIYKIVEYTPAAGAVDYHAASGVDVAVDVLLSGNSVANILLGDAVAADVEGYEDAVRVIGSDFSYYTCILTHLSDLTNKPITGANWATYWSEEGADGQTWIAAKTYQAAGTFTGTPNALIERPDHVRKLILMKLLGFSSDDIDASFDTVGTIYAGRWCGSYKFAFVLHEVATEAMELFRQFDLQTRSNMFESGGKFKLAFSPTSAPTSEITFDKHNIKDKFVFSKIDIVDLKNKIWAHFFRDYSKSGNLGQIYQGVKKVSDSNSILMYGERFEDLEFSCIGDFTDMAWDILIWLLHEKKGFKKIVKFKAFWDAMILEGCDHFTVISNFWSGEKFKTTKLLEIRADETIEIEGLQYIP